MSESPKKQSFLYGTAMLAMATAIVKVIGAIYKIPLNAIIGEQGFGYYSTAYEIYNVLLMISTAGLPVAMSRMISQASALGHYNQVRKIYTTARSIFLGLGLAGSLLMTVFCRQLAAFQNQPDAWAAIGCLGPCCLLICIMSSYRGFLQGQSNMLPTSVSQVIEAIVKLIVGMLAAVCILYVSKDVSLAAGGAILGVTISCLISALYLRRCFSRSTRALPESDEVCDSFAQTAKRLLAIAIPITIGSACLQLITALSSKIYMGQLLSSGVTQESADTMRGVHVMTQTIFNMPCAFITPITISIIPAITSQLTLCQHREVRSTEESAIRITGLICMPCAFGLAILAGPVTALLGGYSGENLILATKLMRILGITVAFNAIVLVTTALMQAHGHAVVPVVNMLCGGILKLIAVYVLTGNPDIGIVGTPIATLLSYVCITVLNLISLRRCISDPPAIARNLVKPFLAAAIMGVFVYLSEKVLTVLGVGSRLVLCGLPVVVGVVVYVAAVIGLKVITRSDCLLLPKGEKIAKLLHL